MSLARLGLALVATAALVPVTVWAAIPRPVPIKPKNGTKLPVGRTPWFKLSSSGHGGVWVHVSESPKRARDGVIGNDAAIVEAHKKGKHFVVKPEFFDYPSFWAKQKKRWYWQAYRIACGEERKASDCKVEGPVRSFRLR